MTLLATSSISFSSITYITLTYNKILGCVSHLEFPILSGWGANPIFLSEINGGRGSWGSFRPKVGFDIFLMTPPCGEVKISHFENLDMSLSRLHSTPHHLALFSSSSGLFSRHASQYSAHRYYEWRFHLRVQSTEYRKEYHREKLWLLAM